MKNIAIAAAFAAAIFANAPVLAADYAGSVSDETSSFGSSMLQAGDELLAAAPGGGGAPGCCQLNLTDDQLEKMVSIKNKMRDAAGPKKLELRSSYRKLQDLLTQSSVNRAEVTALQAKINGLRTDLSNLAIASKLDGIEVLSPDQRQQIRHRYLQRQLRGGHRFGHGRWHHGGHGMMRKTADLGPGAEAFEAPATAMIPDVPETAMVPDAPETIVTPDGDSEN